MLDRLKQHFRREAFLPSRLSVITHPLYIVRRGLYKTISSLAPRIAGDVLDFGCGSKPYESLFTGAKSYVGVDIEASGHSHKDSRVDVYYDGKTLPFPDSRFDAVVSFEVLEHVFNINEVVAEVRRVLKPDGFLLVSVPFAWDEHEVPYDFARYTSYGLRHIFEKNAFEIVELKKTTTYVAAVGQMFISYLVQHVSPKTWLLRKMFQLLVIFPLTMLSLLLSAILPRRYEYFCNCVVLARKRAA